MPIDYEELAKKLEEANKGTNLSDTYNTGLSAVSNSLGSVARGLGFDDAAKALSNTGDMFAGQYSEAKKLQLANAEQRMRDANASGSEWERYKAMAAGALDAPLDFAVQQAGNMAPTLLAAGLTGGAGLVGGGVGAAVGALQGAGDTRQQIADSVRARAISEGMGLDEADALAEQASAYGGGNTDQIALGGALGSADALLGVQKTFGRAAKGIAPTEKLSAKYLAKQAGEEAVPEFFQEGQQALAGNLAQQREGYDQDLMEGVLSQAGFGATVGGLMGAGVGGLAQIGTNPEPFGSDPSAAPAVEQPAADPQAQADQSAPSPEALAAMPASVQEILSTPAEASPFGPVSAPAAPELSAPEVALQQAVSARVDGFDQKTLQGYFEGFQKRAAKSGVSEAEAKLEAVKRVADTLDSKVKVPDSIDLGERLPVARRAAIEQALATKFGVSMPSSVSPASQAPAAPAAAPAATATPPARIKRDAPEVIKARDAVMPAAKKIYEEISAKKGKAMLSKAEHESEFKPLIKAEVARLGLSEELSKTVRHALYTELTGYAREKSRSASPAGVKQIEVGGQKVELTPQIKAITERQAADRAALQASFKAGTIDEKAFNSQKKALEVKQSAELRKAAGKQNAREIAAQQKRDQSYSVGSKLTIDGKFAKVQQVSFGKVKVKFQDGTESTYKHAELKAMQAKLTGKAADEAPNFRKQSSSTPAADKPAERANSASTLQKLNDQVSVSESADKDKVGLIMQAVQELKIAKEAGSIKILGNVSEAAQGTGWDLEMLSQGDRVSGMYDPATDTVYVFTDGVADKAEIKKTVSHEYAHRGWERIFGKQELTELRGGLLKIFNGNALLRNLVQQGQKDGRFSHQDSIETKVNEALAMAAEDPVRHLGTDNAQTLFQKAALAVRELFGRLMKKLGFDISLPSEGRELAFMLKQLHREGYGYARAQVEVEGSRINVPLFRKGTLDGAKADGALSLANDSFSDVMSKISGKLIGEKFDFGGLKETNWLEKFLPNGAKDQITKAHSDSDFQKVHEAVQKLSATKEGVLQKLAGLMDGTLIQIIPNNNGSLAGLARDMGAGLKRFGQHNAALSKIPGMESARKIDQWINGAKSPLNLVDENGALQVLSESQAYEKAIKDGLKPAEAKKAARTWAKAVEFNKDMANQRASEMLATAATHIGATAEQAASLRVGTLEEKLSKLDKLSERLASDDSVMLTKLASIKDHARFMIDEASRGQIRRQAVGAFYVKDMSTGALFRFEEQKDAAKKAAELKKAGKQIETGSTSGTRIAPSAKGLDELITLLDRRARSADADEQSDLDKQIKRSILNNIITANENERSEIAAEREQLAINKAGSSDLEQTLGSLANQAATEISTHRAIHGIAEAITAIPQGRGEVIREAVELARFVVIGDNSKGGVIANKLKGFFHGFYLGFAPSSAILQCFQVHTNTIPVLNQFTKGYAVNPASAGAKQLKVAAGKLSADEQAFVQRLREQGLIGSNMISEIQRMQAVDSKGWGGFSQFWGAMFATADTNAKVSTVLLLRDAVMKDPEVLTRISDKFGYGKKLDLEEAAGVILRESQGEFGASNKPNWARGGVGGILFLFRSFLSGVLGMLSRLPPRQVAMFMLGMVLLAGTGGIPFSDDVMDIVDTLGQMAGFATNSKEWLQKAVDSTAKGVLGEMAGDVVARTINYGLTDYLPVGFANRVALGNIIPATAIFKPSEKNKTDQLLEITGVAGSFVKTLATAGSDLARGDTFKAARSLTPSGLGNMVEGARTVATGEFRSTRGDLIAKYEGSEGVGAGLTKFLGFQPGEVAKMRREGQFTQQNAELKKIIKDRLLDNFVNARINDDEQGLEKARQDLMNWNQAHAGSEMAISPASVKAGIANKMKAKQLSELDRKIAKARGEERARLLAFKKRMEGEA